MVLFCCFGADIPIIPAPISLTKMCIKFAPYLHQTRENLVQIFVQTVTVLKCNIV
jgi:hypothetical protein